MIMNKEFSIDSDGIKLHAKLDMPEDYTEGDRCPLALVIHGLTGHMEEPHIKAVAATFNKLGIASLRVEMYGHGISGGEFSEHNLFKWLNNVMSAMKYIRSLDFVTEVYVAGHSQGGLTALLTAGMYPDVFSAAILLSPASMVPGLAREGSLFKVSFDPCAIPDELYVSETEKVTADYVRAAQLIDMEGAVRRFKKPVLIVHGDEDEAIPYVFSEKLASMYEDAKLVIIKGDDHCYDYHLEQVTTALYDFMSMLRK